MTALLLPSGEGHVLAMELLLNHRANVNAVDMVRYVLSIQYMHIDYDMMQVCTSHHGWLLLYFNTVHNKTIETVKRNSSSY
jgi:hypothetical protein